MGGMSKEELLLVSMRSGDEKAFEEIFEKYAPKLYAFSLRILKNTHEAEEVIQDTFMKVWENRVAIDPGLNFGAWLITVARNKIFTLFRQKMLEAKHMQSLAPAVHETREIEPRLDDINEVLRAQIDKLPRQQREIVLLKNSGFTNGEIAEKLSITKKTVENHLNRAYRELRVRLGEWQGLLLLLLSLPVR